MHTASKKAYMRLILSIWLRKKSRKKANCLKYFEQACRAAQWMGAKRVIFHPGAQGKMEREQAVENILTLFPQILEKLEAQGLLEGITLCPETMGKLGQIGDIEEILCICALDERLIPCVDFGHIYARRLGQFGDKKSFAAILDGIESSLGKERAKQIHVHFSRIEFTKGGEKRHWNYQDIQYGPNFDPLAALLAQRDYTAVVICESSGKMAEDAATYRDMYLKARRHGNMNQRCKTFMQQFDALGIDAALVSSYENVRYLSGFTNTETLLVLDAKEQWLLTDSRYSEQAEKQCPDFTVIKTGHGVSLATGT